MTTDKIRAAAQALFNATRHSFSGPLPTRVHRAYNALHAALAEPAQADPADDAVPVVAYEFEHTYGESTFHPLDEFSTAYRDTAKAIHKPVRQSAHLAAMEALRQENERLKADRSAQVAEVMRLVRAVVGRAITNSDRERLGMADYGACDAETDAYRAVEAAVRKLAGGA